ncbi:hypothetical protein ACFL0D_04950 [Thermoproteota archaeon]
MLDEQINNINQIIEYLEKSVKENSLREQELNKLFEVVSKLITYQEEPNEISSTKMGLTKSYQEKQNDKSSTKMGLARSFFELPEIISRRIFL